MTPNNYFYISLSTILTTLRQEKTALNTFLLKKLYQNKQLSKLNKQQIRNLYHKTISFLLKINVIQKKQISKKIFEFSLIDISKALDLINNAHARNRNKNATNPKKTDLTTDFKQLITTCILPSPRLKASRLWIELNEYRLKSKLDSYEQEEVVSNFELYLNDIVSKVLLFKDINDEIQIKNYTTRFTSKQKAIQTIKTLEEAFNNAFQNYCNAVFLTLTIPPVFPFRVQQWLLSFFLHRIKALIRKKHKQTLPHVKAIEPQASYSIHYHIILFGIDFLMPKHDLTNYLEHHLNNFLSNLGEHYKRTINKRATDEQVQALNVLGKQLLKRYYKYKKKNPAYVGPINYITKVKQEEAVFIFENPPPDRKPKKTMNDGGAVAVFDYLKFYVVKNAQEVKQIQQALDDDKPVKLKNKALAFYWFLRLPFYTLSPKLRPPKPKRQPAEWKFIGSCYIDELEHFLSVII